MARGGGVKGFCIGIMESLITSVYEGVSTSPKLCVTSYVKDPLIENPELLGESNFFSVIENVSEG